MVTQKIVSNLKAQIREELSPLINSDYVYLEIPFYVNPGDILIWKGTEDFLAELPYKCLYRASLMSFEEDIVPKNAIILLQGGGNFGDLYRIIQEFRNRIILSFPNHRIIVLPQTVYYQGYKDLVKDKRIWRKHKDLHICTRDLYSFRFVKWQRFSRNVYLVPDMAFYNDLRYLNSLALPEEKEKLLFKRTDKEFKDIIAGESWQQEDVSDWDLFTNPDEVVASLNSMMYFETEKDCEKINDYLINAFFPHQIQTAVELISQYKKIYCTRLHAAILSVLLGKNVVVLDNSYGKNSHFYDTWLSDVPGVSIIRSRHKMDYHRLIRMIAASFR